MAVQRRTRDVGQLGDGIDRHGVDAAFCQQRGRCVEQPGSGTLFARVLVVSLLFDSLLVDSHRHNFSYTHLGVVELLFL